MRFHHSSFLPLLCYDDNTKCVFVNYLLRCESNPNPEEASQMEFVDVEEIMNDVLKNPGKYAAWFMPALLIATDGEEYGSMNKEVTDRIIY